MIYTCTNVAENVELALNNNHSLTPINVSTSKTWGTETVILISIFFIINQYKQYGFFLYQFIFSIVFMFEFGI
jgi:hypothetical protein